MYMSAMYLYLCRSTLPLDVCVCYTLYVQCHVLAYYMYTKSCIKDKIFSCSVPVNYVCYGN